MALSRKRGRDEFDPWAAKREAARAKQRRMGFERAIRQIEPAGMVLSVPRTRGALAQNGETKYFDSFLSIGNVSEGTSWAASNLDPSATTGLFTPVEGNDIDNRVGRKVSLHKMTLKCVIVCTPVADQADILPPGYIRLILVQDTQTNASTMAGTDLMTAPGAATNALMPTTFQSTNNFGRFKVLKDKVIYLGDAFVAQDNAGGGAATNSMTEAQKYVKFSVNFKNPVVVKFNGTNGGTTADIIDNSFHLIGVKSTTAWAHNVNYTCRSYYKDV